MNRKKIAILGATGIIGQKFIKLLDGHPFFNIIALSASATSAGRYYRDAVDWIIEDRIPENTKDLKIINADIDSILASGAQIVFSALPADNAYTIEHLCAKEGIFVFSNAGAHRMNEYVPILIPEINSEHIELVKYQNYGKGFIVTNSNCCVSGIVFALKPLMKFGLKSVFITTYQSLSGAGRNGVASLDILNNIIPYIQNEEEKIEIETKKILGRLQSYTIEYADFYINASCARVAVKEGHLISFAVELKEEISESQVYDCFFNFRASADISELPMAVHRPIICLDAKDRPQPARDLKAVDTKGMAVNIGRIRKKGRIVNFNLLVDNSIRGAAGTSILNAEYALSKGYLENKENNV